MESIYILFMKIINNHMFVEFIFAVWIYHRVNMEIVKSIGHIMGMH